MGKLEEELSAALTRHGKIELVDRLVALALFAWGEAKKQNMSKSEFALAVWQAIQEKLPVSQEFYRR